MRTMHARRIAGGPRKPHFRSPLRLTTGGLMKPAGSSAMRRVADGAGPLVRGVDRFGLAGVRAIRIDGLSTIDMRFAWLPYKSATLLAITGSVCCHSQGRSDAVFLIVTKLSLNVPLELLIFNNNSVSHRLGEPQLRDHGQS
jgi:hypothetical protein